MARTNFVQHKILNNPYLHRFFFSNNKSYHSVHTYRRWYITATVLIHWHILFWIKHSSIREFGGIIQKTDFITLKSCSCLARKRSGFLNHWCCGHFISCDNNMLQQLVFGRVLPVYILYIFQIWTDHDLLSWSQTVDRDILTSLYW